MRTPGETIYRFLAKRKMSQEDLAAELHVSGGAIRHWLGGRRQPKLQAIYVAWAKYHSGVAGALLAELCPEFRDAIAEQERR